VRHCLSYSAKKDGLNKVKNTMQLTNDSNRLKDIFKQAIIETMEERKDLVHDIIVEALEDAAMIHAIQEGEKSGTASRAEVFKILESKA